MIDPLDLVDAERYGQRGYPHDVWTRLRAEAPVARIEPPGFEPFWAITKHADVQHIAKDPLRFSSAGGITLRPFSAGTLTLCRALGLTMITGATKEQIEAMSADEKQRQLTTFLFIQSQPVELATPRCVD